MPRPVQSLVAVGIGFVLAAALVAAGERAADTLVASSSHEAPAPSEPAATPWASAAGGTLVMWLTWLAGSLGGGWAAARLAPRARTAHALLVGALLMVVTLHGVVGGRHPAWVWLLAPWTFLIPAWAGAWLARPRPA